MYLAVFACVAIALSGNARARSVDERGFGDYMKSVMDSITDVVFGQTEESPKTTYVGKKINVSVYYESHCPDSVKFIKEDLSPNFCNLEKYVNLNLVPFGKAYKTEDGHFRCQHGEKECVGNAIHNCVLKRIQNPITQVGYVNCAMSDPDQPGLIDSLCVKNFGLNVKDIRQCYTSEEGYNLMTEAEKETKDQTSFEKIGAKFVPTIVFDGTYSDIDQKDAFENFENTICKKLKARGYQGVCSQGLILNRTPCS